MKWPISQAIGGVKLQVPAYAAGQALDVLKALDGGEHDGLLDHYEPIYPTRPCSVCDSNSLKPVFAIDQLLLLFASFTIGIIFPIYRNRRRCNNCGKLQQL